MLAIVIGIALMALGMILLSDWMFEQDEFAGVCCMICTMLVIICCLAALTDLGTLIH